MPNAEGVGGVVDTPIGEPDAPDSSVPFLVVGVGASAGGLEAFTQLLRALPSDTGMAFVLVQHLAPSHESALAGLLARATSMPVTEVADEPAVMPNRVYVIPPDRNMILVGSHLQLLPRDARPHHPIDRFFRSLAESQRHRAVGVVLSGTATDGTLGLEDIKAEGGITFAQDDSAQYDGMPRSAVASGCVDYVLSAEAIAGELGRIAAHPLVAPARDVRSATHWAALTKVDLDPVLRVLGTATDVDFTHYRANTLARRIARRMVLTKQEGTKDYAKLLGDSSAEVDALYQDVLIDVTSFFRNPEMFDVLKSSVVPALLEGRPRQDPLRAWVVGCSTGEEAYSLAMVLVESMESANGRVPAQIFATDLNAAGVERARAGVYAKERLENMPRERLRRFFVEVDGTYRVSKPIRDMCVFSRHNVTSDPPFSRMDLVSCRNLLIYLEQPLQQRVIPIFHYALNPNGYLILGASETVGPYRDLFSVQDARHKIFVKKPSSKRLPPLLPMRGTRPTPQGAGTSSRFAAEIRVADLQRAADRLLLAYAPAAVLVDANLDILRFAGNTEPYLAPPQGVATFALLKMARPGLLVPLRALLQRAKKGGEPVREERIRMESSDGIRHIDVKVCPLKGTSVSEGGFLVLFEEASPAGGRAGAKQPPTKSAAKSRSAAPEKDFVRLEHELAITRESLQTLSDQHDAAIEDLQSANEEAQSANEELQSINEELETSKEEIQSSNEELTTLNDELNSRNLELGQLNSDLSNLITSVQIAIVIVGRDLRIRRFSPMAEKLLNIIPADVGRPITDIRMSIDVPELEPLLAKVIDSLTPSEQEIRAKDGRWYALRLRPYLTLEKKIDGAVMMLNDVDAIRRAREYAESIVDTVRDPLLVLDPDLRVRRANHAFYLTFDVERDETEGRFLFELGNGQWDIPDLRRLLGEILPRVGTVRDYEVTHDFDRIGPKTMRLNARRLSVPSEEQEAILLAIEDVSEFSQLAAKVRESAERFKLLFDKSPLPKWTFDAERHRIFDVNEAAIALYGYTREEFLTMEAGDLSQPGHRQHVKKSGEVIDVEVRVNEIELAGKRVLLITATDVTVRNRLESELRARAEELDASNRSTAEFIAVLSHELRTPLNAVSGWAEVLQRPGTSEADRRAGIEIIARNAKMQAQLISDLLDVNRITSGKLSLQLGATDFRGEIEAAIEAAVPAVRDKELRMEADLGETSVLVLADPPRLQQVLGNLISNAIKFTPEGGEIRVVLRRRDDRAEASVSDSGRGISPESLPYIFRRFRQSDTLAGRHESGLGLGLAVSKHLVELHGGEIAAQSPGAGQGATFTISLPLLSDSRPVVAANTGSPEPEARALRGVMVLVVDDEVEAREPLRRLLESYGAEVVSVRSADEALEVIDHQSPDVLVSDIRMPQRDGYELIAALRALPASRGGAIPAIALTAFGTAEDRERALRAGYMMHFAKPVEGAALVAAVSELSGKA